MHWLCNTLKVKQNIMFWRYWDKRGVKLCHCFFCADSWLKKFESSCVDLKIGQRRLSVFSYEHPFLSWFSLMQSQKRGTVVMNCTVRWDWIWFITMILWDTNLWNRMPFYAISYDGMSFYKCKFIKWHHVQNIWPEVFFWNLGFTTWYTVLWKY